MSQENVKVVRGAFASMTFPGDPEAMVTASDPSFEMHLVGVGGELCSTREPGASMSGFATWPRVGISLRFEATELRDLGDRVLVLGDVSGCGRASGIEVDDRWAWIVEVRDGRATSLRGFLDRREALEAAGLRE